MVLNATHEVDGAATAAEHVVDMHFRLAELLRAGLTLEDIDRFVAQSLQSMECRSAFLRYRIPAHPPFPSHSCLSVNDCIVHGTHIMDKRRLEPGDVISIDIGTSHKGWIGDAAWTYAIEHASDTAQKLMHCGRESLRLGVEAMQPGRPLLDWARTVEEYVEKECGFRLVRGLGGHGYGRKLHGPPFVSNVTPRHRQEWPDAWTLFEPGLLLAVEPMIAVSSSETRSTKRQWPIFTADGSLAVHYEADVLITETGPRNLTEAMYDLPDIVGN